jgi:hypothetical protein
MRDAEEEWGIRDKRGVGRFDLMRDAEEECGMRGERGVGRFDLMRDAEEECGMRGERGVGRFDCRMRERSAGYARRAGVGCGAREIGGGCRRGER